MAGKAKKLSWRQRMKELYEEMMAFQIDPIHQITFRQQIHEYTSSLLGYGKSKLDKPGIDNEKTIAETRKLHAEACAIEFKVFMDKFKFKLSAIICAVEMEQPDEMPQVLKAIQTFNNFLDDPPT